MKKSISLVLATLLFVVLGCNFGSSDTKEETAPTPAADTTSSDNTGSSSSDSSSSSSGEKADLSMDKFNKIELEMDYDKVKEIMGSEGDKTSETKNKSYESQSYEWKGDKFARIRTSFRDGKLVSKSQSGITESKGDAQLTQDKFNKINTGMSYSEVKDIIGSEGEMTSMSKFGSTTSTNYRWRGPNYENIFTSFRDDKLNNKSQSNLK